MEILCVMLSTMQASEFAKRPSFMRRRWSKRPKEMVDFMMRFGLGLEQPDPRRAVRSALTIGASYVVGGFIPLAPYVFVTIARESLPVSVAVTLVALFVFGYVKGRFTGAGPVRSSIQTTIIGSLAAAAFLIARAVS